MRLTTQDLERIAAAVGKAETKTSGEIVCAIARRSSDYAYVPPLWAAFFALLAPWPMAMFTNWPTRTIYAAQILIFMIAALLVWQPPLRLALTPRLVKKRRAERAAIEQFFLRGVAPPEVTTGDIYRGIIPFVGMQILALVLVFVFPGIALWLPKAIGW